MKLPFKLPQLPLFIRKLICQRKGHRRGVVVNEPPFGMRVFRCPRCERRTRYPVPKSQAA